MKLLRRSEKKDLFKRIDKDYNCNSAEIFGKKALFIDGENNVFMISKDFDRVDLKQFRIKSAGLLIGYLSRGFIFTVEGSQLIGNFVKNKAELDFKGIEGWVKGKDVRVNLENGLYVVKYGNDFYGSGFVLSGVLKNTLDKMRIVKEDVKLD